MKSLLKSYCVIIFLVVHSYNSYAQNANDKNAVETAINNYIDAFYNADTAKAYESVAKDLAKKGYFTSKDGRSMEGKMTFEQLVRLAHRWKYNQVITAETPRKITVFDVLDRIASAKVEAKWGIDYFHLAKIGSKWIIMNVLWQDYPSVSQSDKP